MEQIKISVVIPVYNAEKFIEKCIESVIDQTLKEIEIIVINDGSKDNSLKVIKNYEKNKKVKILNIENSGSSKTRNLGIYSAKGEYVLCIDADDYLEDKLVLEKLYNKCKCDKLDILVFDFYRENNGKKEYAVNIDVSNEQEILKENYIRDLIKGKWGMNIWSKIVKTELFIKNDVIFPEYIFYGEDLVTSLKLVYFAKKIGKINEALYNYVQHESQGTKKIDKAKRFLDSYNYYLEMEKFIKEKGMYSTFKNDLLNRKCRLFEKVSAKKYENTEVYKKIRENMTLENKTEFLECEYYKKLNIIKKLRFRLRLNKFYKK